jgi:hypothetical protein
MFFSDEIANKILGENENEEKDIDCVFVEFIIFRVGPCTRPFLKARQLFRKGKSKSVD